MSERRIFRKREFIYLLAVLALAGTAWFFMSAAGSGQTAIVECRGIEIDRIPLGERLAKTYDGVTIVFEKSGVWVEKAPCPDKLCMRTGKITKAGEAAVCLPAGVSVRLTGGEGYDALTY